MQSRLEGESRCSDYVTIKWFHAVELSINDRPHRAERLPRALTGYAKPVWAISRVWLSKVSLIRMSYSLVKPGIYGGNRSGYDIRLNETFDSQTLEIAQIGLVPSK